MQDLDLGWNSLWQLPAEVWANLFSGLTKLQKLILNDNSLSELPAEVFSGLSNLQDLDLGENWLGQLPAEVWANLFSGPQQVAEAQPGKEPAQ